MAHKDTSVSHVMGPSSTFVIQRATVWAVIWCIHLRHTDAATPCLDQMQVARLDGDFVLVLKNHPSAMLHPVSIGSKCNP